MKVDLFILSCSLLICCIEAEWRVVQQIPINTMPTTNKQFFIQIDQPVNRPNNATFIRFVINSNRSATSLDVSNSTNVTYGNTTLTFSISDPVPWNVSDQVSIFFDEGVLYSNATVKSTHQNQTTFWTLTVFDPPMIVNATTAQPQTTARAMTSMPTETSGHPVTSMMATGQTNPTNTTATTSSPVTVGESSPTRSAQWGMGLGITFITLIVVGEVIYFKYCYSDYGRSGSYYT